MTTAPGPIRRGDLFWIAPDALLARDGPASTSSQPHPHVVVQDDLFNASRIPTVVVCALSTQLAKAGEPGNVLLDDGEGGLPRRSVVVATQIDAVPKAGLGQRIGALSPARVDEILAGLRFVQGSFLER